MTVHGTPTADPQAVLTTWRHPGPIYLARTPQKGPIYLAGDIPGGHHRDFADHQTRIAARNRRPTHLVRRKNDLPRFVRRHDPGSSQAGGDQLAATVSLTSQRSRRSFALSLSCSGVTKDLT
jgi:hypothetical protein